MDLQSHPLLGALAEVQHGVLSTAQLDGRLSRGTVRAAVQARRWSRSARGVIVLHNGELTGVQRTWVALLQCPDGSAVSGPTAAALDGMIDAGMSVHVTMPCGHRRPADIGAEVHWSRFLDEPDVHPSRAPRRTRLPRSVVDWASWQTVDRAARRIVLSAVQQRLTSPDQLRTHLARRGPCRHHALIVESINDSEGGIASVPERDFTELLREGGLPEPSRQAIRRRPNGRYYLDADWEGYRYSAEIEGAHHFEVSTREQDLDRLNELVVQGDRVLQFSSFAVRRRREMVAGVLRRALRSAGWSG